VLGESREPEPLGKLAEQAAAERALVLEYVLGVEGGYVLVIPGEGGNARLEELKLGEAQASVLGVAPGPLTARKFESLLRRAKGEGVYDGLAAGRHDKPLVAKLAALWQVLIPEVERKGIEAGKYRRLVVIPDGSLSQLPFETLVLRAEADPKYLLDAGVPVLYAPSAKVLASLRRREAQPLQGSVLTVGDCLFGKVVMPPSRPGAAPEILSPERLHFSDWEVDWVAKALGKARTTVLKRQQATEASVRKNAPNGRLLHFACHGLVDHSYGNLFGVLALTPGPDPDNPADDGFLTLADIYQLDLARCELAILSACDTNVGPQQRGEGVWALSRGFLVAGCGRVVASNWLVDDEAAATLVYWFCQNLAQTDTAGPRTDYAQALHAAKRSVRQQERWQNPLYWAPFVLIGPP